MRVTDTLPAPRRFTYLRVPGSHDHKYTRGVLSVWAGSETYPGAAVLTCAAAVRTGAGMVRLMAPRRVQDLVLAARPEVVPATGRCQALVVGPGTDPADEPRMRELRDVLRQLVRTPLPVNAVDASLGGGPGAESVGGAPGGVPDAGEDVVSPYAPGTTARRGAGPLAPVPQGVLPAVVDAGALSLLPGLLEGGTRLTHTTVLTPHAGEAADLLSGLGRPTERAQVEAAQEDAARRLAIRTGATVLLKGARCVIATPRDTPPRSRRPSRLWTAGPGPAWLATAGSGDVLAGILGAVLAGAQADTEGGTLPPPSAGGLTTAVQMPLPRVRGAVGLAVRLHRLAAQAAAGPGGGAGAGGGGGGGGRGRAPGGGRRGPGARGGGGPASGVASSVSQAPGPGHAVAAMDLACELPGIIEDLYRAEGPLLLANEEERWLALGGVTGTQ